MAEQRYQIREKIGRGGLGDVYVAYDTQLDREVALKRLRPTGREVADADLLKEAKVLSSLQHPNIVTLYDVGRDDEGPFAVMELLKGETLDRTVERGALTFEDFRNVVTQSLEGMIAAQSAGLLHRDIKPTNIMVIWLPSGKFQIKILDFGLAKFSRQPSEQTSDLGDGIMGSIYFMAPEQFERLPLDPRTDMYSLGCVYYHALTQRHPFEGESAPQVMASHLRHDVRELGELRPDVPEGVTTWVMWMINRQMEDRPADARQALEIFQHVLADYERSKTTSVPPPPTFQPRPATRPVLLATATGASAAATAGGPRSVRVGVSTGRLPTGAGGPAAPAVPTLPSAPAAPYGAPGFRRPAGRLAKKKGGFPMWALVTVPLLLVAAGLFAWWQHTQGGRESMEFAQFEDLYRQERPQGDATTVRMLIGYLEQEGSNGLAAAQTLAKLEGAGVSEEMVRQLGGVRGTARRNLIRALMLRGYNGAAPALIKLAAETSDPEIRYESLVALTELAGENEVDDLLRLIPKLGSEKDKTALEMALVRVLRERRDPERRAEPLIAAIGASQNARERDLLMSAMARLGGTGALDAVRRQLETGDGDTREAAVRALASWGTSAAGGPLLELALGDPDPLTRVVALFGYIDVLTAAADLSMGERADRLDRALEVSEAIDDAIQRGRVRQRVVEALGTLPDERALAIVRRLADDEKLGAAAKSAASGIESRIREVIVLGQDGGSLTPLTARILGEGARVASRADEVGVIADWKDPGTSVSWFVRFPEPGVYRIRVHQGAEPAMGGRYQVRLADTLLEADVKKTGSLSEYAATEVGTVEIAPAGTYQLGVRPLQIDGDALMVLRLVEVEPVVSR